MEEGLVDYFFEVEVLIPLDPSVDGPSMEEGWWNSLMMESNLLNSSSSGMLG